MQQNKLILFATIRQELSQN